MKLNINKQEILETTKLIQEGKIGDISKQVGRYTSNAIKKYNEFKTKMNKLKNSAKETPGKIKQNITQKANNLKDEITKNFQEGYKEQ